MIGRPYTVVSLQKRLTVKKIDIHEIPNLQKRWH